MGTRLFVVLVSLLALAGCGATTGTRVARANWSPVPSGSAAAPRPVSGVGTAPVAPAPAAASPSACTRDGWDCAQAQRFDAVAGYAAKLSGTVGVVVRDRRTGAVWRTGATGAPMWTASTIKVAIAADLLERNRSGDIDLSDADRAAMADMLRLSSNDATDLLWGRYHGPQMLDRFRSAYGMTGLSVVDGQVTYWRNLRCTADDLDHLMTYVLGDHLAAADRAYLVDALRGVAANQHWGVWAVGDGFAPGNKDGWAEKPDSGGDHWVTHTVGFAGPGERYVLVVMYSLPPSGSVDDGVQAVSDLAALALGAPTPAVVQPPA